MERESDDYGMDDLPNFGTVAGSYRPKHWIVRRLTPNLLATVVACCFFLGWYVAYPVEHFGPKDTTDLSKPPSHIDLPRVYSIVQQITYEKFDDAAHAGTVHYDPIEPELFSRNAFNWSFTISPVLGSVPDHSTAIEDIVRIGETHILSINRRAPYRPTLILKPLVSEPSTADLHPSDILVATAVLRAFHPPMIMAVSFGENAADPAQPKTMRVFAQPRDFELWPNRAWSDFHPTFDIPDVPFRHFAMRLHPLMPGKDVVRNFNRVLAEAKKTIAKRPDIHGVGYTVIMTNDWIVAIPRRHAGPPPGDFASPPEVMLGLVSGGSQEERDYWDLVQYEATLAQMGVAFNE